MAAWIGPAISAGASLLGGIFGRSAARRDARRAEQRADPAAIRARFEAAGFNPLLGIGGATPNPGLSSYQMGTDILMNSLAAAGDGFGEAATLRMQNTELQKQSERLDDLVHQATLGSSIGGIYDAVPNRPVNSPDRRPARSAGAVGAALSDSQLDGGQLTPIERGAIGYQDDDGNIYGNSPDHFNPNALPQITFGGMDLTGTGNFSGGQSFEDALGEGPLQWAMQPVLLADMFANEADENRARGNLERGELGLSPWEELPALDPGPFDPPRPRADLPSLGIDAWGGQDQIDRINWRFENRGRNWNDGYVHSGRPSWVYDDAFPAIRGQLVHDWP